MEALGIHFSIFSWSRSGRRLIPWYANGAPQSLDLRPIIFLASYWSPKTTLANFQIVFIAENFIHGVKEMWSGKLTILHLPRPSHLYAYIFITILLLLKISDIIIFFKRLVWFLVLKILVHGFLALLIWGLCHGRTCEAHHWVFIFWWPGVKEEEEGPGPSLL